jgi:hypothetical protein
MGGGTRSVLFCALTSKKTGARSARTLRAAKPTSTENSPKNLRAFNSTATKSDTFYYSVAGPAFLNLTVINKIKFHSQSADFSM